MLQFHMWLSFLHPQGVSLQKDQKGLNSYKSSCSFESYVAKQMLYREREHPLKTIWCLLINKNPVLGVLQQKKEKESTCGSGLLSENMQVPSLCSAEEQILYSTVMSALCSQLQWHLAGFDMLMLRLSCLRPGTKPFTCSLVLPCRYPDSLGSLLAREFSGHLISHTHICSEVPFLGRQTLRSYLKLCCVSGLCG